MLYSHMTKLQVSTGSVDRWGHQKARGCSHLMPLRDWPGHTDHITARNMQARPSGSDINRGWAPGAAHIR